MSRCKQSNLNCCYTFVVHLRAIGWHSWVESYTVHGPWISWSELIVLPPSFLHVGQALSNYFFKALMLSCAPLVPKALVCFNMFKTPRTTLLPQWHHPVLVDLPSPAPLSCGRSHLPWRYPKFLVPCSFRAFLILGLHGLIGVWASFYFPPPRVFWSGLPCPLSSLFPQQCVDIKHNIEA